jgi:hypothetical protein
MKPFENDNEIGAALGAMRPVPRPEFAAELDARAAAGFPRRPGGAGSRLAGVLDRWRAKQPRRVLAPAGAAALAVVVVATAVVVFSESGTPTSTSPDAQRQMSAPAPEAVGRQELGEPPAKPAAGSSSGSSETAYQAAPPVPLDAAPRESGPYAAHAGRREIERSAEIVLGAEPSEVRADSAKVFDAVHAADGIVLRSAIRDGAEGEAGAEFELLIPSGKLGDALAAFSGIGEVRSRHESTQDITAPTIGVGERLRDAQARIESLLAQLAGADTEGERAAIEAELRAERGRAAALRSRLSSLRRRANFARVSLRIETGAASEGAGEGGGWGVSDGMDDAGRILAVAAGVTIVGLALLAPFALVFLLAWLARRTWLQRSRARALARP